MRSHGDSVRYQQPHSTRERNNSDLWKSHTLLSRTQDLVQRSHPGADDAHSSGDSGPRYRGDLIPPCRTARQDRQSRHMFKIASTSVVPIARSKVTEFRTNGPSAYTGWFVSGPGVMPGLNSAFRSNLQLDVWVVLEGVRATTLVSAASLALWP